MQDDAVNVSGDLVIAALVSGPGFSGMNPSGRRRRIHENPQALFVACVLALVGSYVLVAQQGGSQMTFFITMRGMGNGGNLGRSRRSRQTLPDARAGRRRRAPGNGRRIQHPGPRRRERARPYRQGPLDNAKGVVIAKSLDDLHGASNNLTKETQLTEKARSSTGEATTRTPTTS